MTVYKPGNILERVRTKIKLDFFVNANTQLLSYFILMGIDICDSLKTHQDIKNKYLKKLWWGVYFGWFLGVVLFGVFLVVFTTFPRTTK